VLAAVAFGFFTSMNQALVGAMAGAGFARGRETVHLATLVSILQGWVLGPAVSIAAGYVFGLLVR
jgi:PiT family inorganic phosphate transporter